VHRAARRRGGYRQGPLKHSSGAIGPQLSLPFHDRRQQRDVIKCLMPRAVVLRIAETVTDDDDRALVKQRVCQSIDHAGDAWT
jgi:hypothetical protein